MQKYNVEIGLKAGNGLGPSIQIFEVFANSAVQAKQFAIERAGGMSRIRYVGYQRVVK